MKYFFNNYELCTDTHELRYKNKLKKIEPLIFKLLIFMLENSEQVLTHDELIEHVWDSRVISNSALCATICAARKVIGDSASNQKCIKTVSGTGYRFIADFTTSKDKSATKSCSPSDSSCSLYSVRPQDLSVLNTSVPDDTHQSQSPELPDKPSVAVMNFIDQSNQPEGSILARGLTTEINSMLSRLPHLFVIARASSECMAGLALSAKETGLRLGVRYLIYATTQYVSKRIRITLSVVDAPQDTEIWSEHYDRSVDDLFLVQKDIVSSIIDTIDSVIEQAEIERALYITTENLNAWENYHRGLYYMNVTTRKGVNTAQYYFKQALFDDVRFARANAGLAYTYGSCKLLGDSFSDKNALNKALESAQLSIDYCKRDTMGYMSLGRTLYFMQKYKKSHAIIEQGLQLNPNNIHCIYFKAVCASVLGKNSEAQLYFDRVEQLSPHDPLLFSIKMARAVSLVQQKKYSEAADLSLIATCCPNAYFATYAIAAICLQLAGRTKQAQEYAKRVLELKPDYSIELHNTLNLSANNTIKIKFVQALRQIGIPEKTIVS